MKSKFKLAFFQHAGVLNRAALTEQWLVTSLLVTTACPWWKCVSWEKGTGLIKADFLPVLKINKNVLCWIAIDRCVKQFLQAPKEYNKKH